MTVSPLVGVVMGSSSDWEIMRYAVEQLTNLGILWRSRCCGDWER